MKSKFKKIIGICSVMVLALGVSLPAYAEPNDEKTINPSQSEIEKAYGWHLETINIPDNTQNSKSITNSGDVIEKAVYGGELKTINIDDIQAAYENTPDVEITIIPQINPIHK